MCNGHLSRLKLSKIEEKCPYCGNKEPSTHATMCNNKEWKELFYKSVTETKDWLEQSHTEPHLETLIVEHLKERERKRVWLK